METSSKKKVIKVIVATCGILLVLLIFALIYNLVELSAVNKRRDELAAQAAELDRIIENNEAMIDYAQTAEFIEDYARDYLDMIYRGEIIIDVK